MKKFIVFFLCFFVLYFVAESIYDKWQQIKKPPANKTLSVDYKAVNDAIGCASHDSDDKKADIFKNDYQDKFVIWSGVIQNIEDNRLFINSDGVGLSDFVAELTDNNAAYNAKIGDRVTVKFRLKRLGSCKQPFRGDNGILQ